MANDDFNLECRVCLAEFSIIVDKKSEEANKPTICPFCGSDLEDHDDEDDYEGEDDE